MLRASLRHKLEVGLAWLANWPSITVKRFISKAYLDLVENNILKILHPVEVDLVFLCMVGKLAHFHCTFIFFFRPALTLDSNSVTYPNILTVSQSEFSSFLRRNIFIQRGLSQGYFRAYQPNSDIYSKQALNQFMYVVLILCNCWLNFTGGKYLDTLLLCKEGATLFLKAIENYNQIPAFFQMQASYRRERNCSARYSKGIFFIITPHHIPQMHTYQKK